MRYVVRCEDRSFGDFGRRMTLGWDTIEEQESCAKLYEAQGWTVTLVSYPTE